MPSELTPKRFYFLVGGLGGFILYATATLLLEKLRIGADSLCEMGLFWWLCSPIPLWINALFLVAAGWVIHEGRRTVEELAMLKFLATLNVILVVVLLYAAFTSI